MDVIMYTNNLIDIEVPAVVHSEDLIEVLLALDITNTPIAIDTETAGLYGDIQLVQLYQKHWGKVVLLQVPDSMELACLAGLLEQASDVVFHNSSYDVSCFHQQIHKWIPKNVQDTLLLSRLAFPKMQEFTLDKCYWYALKYNPYRVFNIDKKAMQKMVWTGELTDEQIQYASMDVYYLLDLFDKVKFKKTEPSYILDRNCLLDCWSWQANGIPISQDECGIAKEVVADGLAGLSLPDSLNVNSYVQVRAFLGGTDKSDKFTLTVLKLKGGTYSNQAGEIMAKKSLLKRLNFIETYQNSLGSRIRGILAPLAKSGRLTCKNINLQQFPKKLKHLVVAPRGRILIYSDFSSLEMRCIAAIIGDVALLELLSKGISPHDYTAERIFGSDFTEKQYGIAKTMNFLLLFGGGIARLQASLIEMAGIFVDLATVKRYRDAWLAVFYGIAEWHEDGYDAHRHKETWFTPMGREYLGRLGTDHLNITVQGMGAETAKLGRLYAKRAITKADLDDKVIMCNFKHDDYLYDVEDDPRVYKEVCKIVGDSMYQAWVTMMSLERISIPLSELDMPVSVDAGYQLSTIDNTASKYNYSLINGSVV